MNNHDYNREKLINLFDVSLIPEKFINEIDKGKIEFVCISHNNNIVSKVAELSIIYPDMYRKIFVVYDHGYCIKFDEIAINEFMDKDSRDKEICRLYNEAGLSQVFIGHLFKISQPSVSLILKKKRMLKHK